MGGLVLALVAAMLFAAAAVLQQRAARASARPIWPRRWRKGLRLANLVAVRGRGGWRRGRVGGVRLPCDGVARRRPSLLAGAPLAAVTLLNPTATTVIGLVAWHEQLAAGALAVLAATAVGLVVTGVGVTVLSRSPLLHPAPRRAE